MARAMKDSGIDYLGTIPSDWRVTRGKHILWLLQRPVRDDDGVITCFRDGEVTLRTNRRTDGFTVSLKEIGYQGIEAGDLVVHGMDGFAGAIGVSDSRGKASPVLNVLDSSEDKRYLMYLLRALAFREVYLALADGIRVRSCNLSWKKIGNLLLALPPLHEQRSIADYLDTKCAEIDHAIEAAEQSIEEMKQLRQAYLDDVIDECWAVYHPMKLKYVLREQKEKSPDGVGEPLSITIARGVLLSSEIDVPFSASSKIGAKIVRANDLVFNKLKAYFGVMYVSPYDGLVSPDYAVYRALPDVALPKYIEYVVHTSRIIDEFIIRISGVADGFRRLYTDDLFDVVIPVPPINKQQAIIDRLVSLYEDIDCATTAKQSIIDDLKTYKKSLVYEVVTGKREV